MLLKLLMNIYNFLRRKYYNVMYTDLLMCNDRNTPMFGLRGLRGVAKVTSVQHGDVLNIVTRIGGYPHRFNVKMQGYESPHEDKSTGNEQTIAQVAKANLLRLTQGKLLRVTFGQLNQKGQYLVTLHTIEGECINDTMIKHRCGVPFGPDGKKKIGLLFDPNRNNLCTNV